VLAFPAFANLARENAVNLARPLLNALRVFAQSFINGVEGFDMKRRQHINFPSGADRQ